MWTARTLCGNFRKWCYMRVTSRPITGWVRNLVRILPDRHLAVRTLPIPMTTGQANGRLTDINWPVAFQYDPANCIPLSVGMFEVWIPRSCNRFRSFNTCRSHDTSQRIFTLRTVRTASSAAANDFLINHLLENIGSVFSCRLSTAVVLWWKNRQTAVKTRQIKNCRDLSAKK